ncbi:MAG: enolase C-terminal domain-like protein [Candidatus Sumerlaeia bacterium]
MAELKIEKVQCFLTQPGRSRHVIVKVQTSEDGLYGIGCGTFTQRHRAVEAAIKHHIGPYVIGRDPRNIEDIWQGLMVNGYWRNGPVLNNAISGIDMALWDIKGKLAGMPCYDLWGGKCRPAAPIYGHATGSSHEEVLEKCQGYIQQGYQFIRAQIGRLGNAGGYAGLEGKRHSPEGALPGAYFDPREKLREIPALFAYLRENLPPEIELVHDVHERLAPVDAIWLARALEPYRLYFLEDILAPEDGEWFRQVRSVCATPIAMGELFNNPREVAPLIAERLIDFVRVHVSQIGGISPALKLTHLANTFGVRTAWHGPEDTSPVGMAASLHLDVSSINFGVQEWVKRSELEYEMFPGTPEIRNGYAYPNDKPGLGIDFDEKMAAQYPCDSENPDWTESRLPDGGLWRP